MDNFGSMSAYDFVVIGLFVLLVGRGLWLGLLKQVTMLFALYLGYFAASQYHETLFPMLKDISENPKVVFLVSYVLLFAATYVGAMLVGKGLSSVIQLTIAGWFDRLLGGVVGFAKAIILVVLLHIVLGTVLAPENQMLRTCVTCEPLNDVADITRELIKSEEVRKSFIQKQPAIPIDAVKEYLVPSDKAID